jgi:hypothetical protein
MGGILVRNVFWLIAVAAVGATLWGCGGDSSSSTTAASNGGTATTENGGGGANGPVGATSKTEGSSSAKTEGSSQAKTEFVDQANAICKEGKKKGLGEIKTYVKAHPPSAGSSTEAKVALLGEALRTVFLPEVQNQVDEIRALGLPQGEEGQVEAILDAMEEGVEASSKSSTGLKLGLNFERSAELAREYGLDSCAYG